MIQTSEWVSTGHPDKIADYISSYLLDRYLEHDPNTRYAVEVQIKNHHVTLGGEITSAYEMSDSEIAAHVRAAVCEIGYTDGYRDVWGRLHTISGNDLAVTIHIGQQSPDIAQGVDRSGWGDQGIFWGMASASKETTYMPRDHWLAKTIGERILSSRLGGLDVKTQVTLDDNRILNVVAAVPLLNENDKPRVEALIRSKVGPNVDIVVNGTGKFYTHASVGDCGTTGRKLAVDFYGGACRLGAGSPWGKDGTKADVALNIYARKLALEYMKAHDLAEVFCSIACCIGQKDLRITFFDDKCQLDTKVEARPAEEIIADLRLREPRFALRCHKGLFIDA